MAAQKTPLYEAHLALGGKMADFAGWEMPLWYGQGQVAEHHATRNQCGLFDICHMGEFKIEGEQTLSFLQGMVTNNIEKIADGQASYNFLLNEQAGVIDDCILYRFREDKWMMVVNASNMEADFDWLAEHAPKSITLVNISSQIAKIDIQGPVAPKVMAQWIDHDILSGLKFFRFLPKVQIENMEVLVSRTGYTGEVGFELYVQADQAVTLWNLLLEKGKAFGIQPCGLGARDTLRTEAGLPLHGHELSPEIVSAGHPWMFAIDMEHDFIGKTALIRAIENHKHPHVYPFTLDGRRKAMSGWEVLSENEVIGQVVSGVIAPTLENKPIGFMRVNRPLEVDAVLSFRQPGRDAVLAGKVVSSPFVSGTARKKINLFL